MFLESTEAWQLLSLCTALTVAFLLAVHFTKLKTKVPLFYSWIGAIAIFGGALAFLLPIALDSGFGKDDDGRVLRQLILYTTGGVLGVITLGESHRKNNQEKEKNENDHTRQVYAERRSRYTKAIEQLADEKATIRLGGIYTLVGLVDEWLADDSLEQDEQQKEGQVIINNLCSYIRSPFPLAEKIDEYEARQELKELESKKPDTLLPDESPKLDTLRKRFEDSAEYQEPDNIAALQAAFHEEQDVRRAIFKEMSKRSSKVSMGKNKKVTVTPGTWSTLGFDFSRAPIFYPLNNLTIEQGNFVSARFYGEADFGGAKFSGAANFRDAKFAGAADFRDAKFAGAADFGGAEFTGLAYFDYAEFTGGHAEFDGAADFNNAKFTGNANFENAMFAGDADFDGAKFAGAAYFGEAEFAGTADFDGAKFARTAGFGNATFTENAYFSSAEFTEDAYFRGAEFSGKTSFEEAYFEKCAPIFADASNSARFSAQVDPQDYLFETRPESPHGFSCGEAELLNRTFILPLGAVLYDPDSWDEEKQDYTRFSGPAQ